MTEEKTIWSVGGGKGGVGKSVVTANIGCALARMGKRVILVDADLGGANLHTYFGIRHPSRGLDDFLKKRVDDLSETALPTVVEGLRLISGGGEFLGIANPAYAQKQKLIGHIKKLDADYIIVDLGAGSTYNVLDFFAVSSQGIVVLVPEPAAIQNAYLFLKSFVYRRLARLFSGDTGMTALINEATDISSPGSVKTFSDLCERIAAADVASAERALAEVKGFRPRVLLNMATSVEDLRVVDAFRNAVGTFLSLDTEFIGTMYSRREVKAAARKMVPFMLDDTAVEARADMASIIEKLLEGAHSRAGQGEGRHAEAGHVFGFNDNFTHSEMTFHVQTEVSGAEDPVVETVIYHGGRIFFSKKTRWSEVLGIFGDQGLREFAQKQHRTAMAAVKMNRITFKG